MTKRQALLKEINDTITRVEDEFDNLRDLYGRLEESLEMDEDDEVDA